MIDKRFITRRDILKLSALGVGGFVAAALIPKAAYAQTDDDDSPFNFVLDPENPASELEKEHIINLRLPLIAEDGSNVPIIATMENHPMESDHYIKNFMIYNFNDPIVSKGRFTFTPANGLAHYSTQIRMDGGDANVFVVAECTQHGKWAIHGTLKVSLGGC